MNTVSESIFNFAYKSDGEANETIGIVGLSGASIKFIW